MDYALAIAIAFMSFSAPITASIVARSRNGNGHNNGKYVTTREYDGFKTDLGDRLCGIENELNNLCTLLKSRFK
jgi:hypothetical protein